MEGITIHQEGEIDKMIQDKIEQRSETNEPNRNRQRNYTFTPPIER